MCSCCQQKPRFFVDPEVAAINDRECSGQRCAQFIRGEQCNHFTSPGSRFCALHDKGAHYRA